ncbi:MAG: SMP-30/gluconolactonase/LRE family protein [Candidatus Omnitrophota bacterium]
MQGLKKCLVLLLVVGLAISIVSSADAAKMTKGKLEQIATIPVEGLIEGPAYCTTDGNWYFVEIATGWVSRITVAGAYERFYDIGSPGGLGPNGMVWDDQAKKLLIAHRDKGICSLDIRTKQLEILADNYQGEDFLGPNDLVLDSAGNIYFTDPWGSSLSNPIGRVYRLDRVTGEVMMLFDNLAFPNGLAISPDGMYIYVGEFGANRLLRAFLFPEGKGTIFLHVCTYFNFGGGPDGMAMDVNGNLYIAHWGMNEIIVVEGQQGQIIDRIMLPDDRSGPTRIAFGGPDNKLLFITETAKNEIWTVSAKEEGLAIPPPKK